MFSLFARYSINERLEFRGGIDNLLDEEPRDRGGAPSRLWRHATPTSRDADYYDILGRRAYIGLKMSF